MVRWTSALKPWRKEGDGETHRRALHGVHGSALLAHRLVHVAVHLHREPGHVVVRVPPLPASLLVVQPVDVHGVVPATRGASKRAEKATSAQVLGGAVDTPVVPLSSMRAENPSVRFLRSPLLHLEVTAQRVQRVACLRSRPRDLYGGSKSSHGASSEPPDRPALATHTHASSLPTAMRPVHAPTRVAPEQAVGLRELGDGVVAGRGGGLHRLRPHAGQEALP
jgi:hypothetical protein